MSIPTATLERLRAIVGLHCYFDQSTDIEPFLVDHRLIAFSLAQICNYQAKSFQAFLEVQVACRKIGRHR